MHEGQKTFEVWVTRAAGAAVLAGFIFGLIPFFENRTLGAFAAAIGFGLGAGFLVGLVGSFIGIIVSAAIDGASSYRNPFVQGAAFVGLLVLFIGATDFFLLRGVFVVWPALSVIFTGELGDSYWGCRDHWVFVDEGAFCDR